MSLSLLALRLFGFSAITVAAVSWASAAEPGPDLKVEGVVYFEKCPGNSPCYIKKFTLNVLNSGVSGQAGKSAVEVWVSEDNVLSPSDILLKRVPVGKIEAGDFRKRTLGGGQFKKVQPTVGNYFIFVVDPDNVVPETNEFNTIVHRFVVTGS